MRERVLSLPVLSISPWLEERKDDYRDHLLNLSVTGEWEPWIEFFVEAVHVESERSRGRIDRLLNLQEEMSEGVRDRMPRGRLAVDVMDGVIKFPVVTVAKVARSGVAASAPSPTRAAAHGGPPVTRKVDSSGVSATGSATPIAASRSKSEWSVTRWRSHRKGTPIHSIL